MNIINESNCALKPNIIELIKGHVSDAFPAVLSVTVEPYNTREGNTVRLRESFTDTVVGIVNLFKATVI